MVKAIIFDFDLTLFDSLYIGRKAREFLKDKHNIQMLSISEKQAFGINHESFAKALEKDNPNTLPWQEIDKINLKYMKKLYDKGILQHINLLQDLNKKEIKLAIISGNTSKIILDFLNNKNNKNKVKFDYILTTDGLYEGKTKADLIKELLKNWNIKNKECMYVGDHPNDIIAAKEAKIISIAVPTGLNDKEELKSYNPDKIINNLEELIIFI
jgi:phosphatidylglycerol---prolipoprotein diacylglyceryl transferase